MTANSLTHSEFPHDRWERCPPAWWGIQQIPADVLITFRDAKSLFIININKHIFLMLVDKSMVPVKKIIHLPLLMLMHLQDVHKTYSDLEVLEVKFTDITLSFCQSPPKLVEKSYSVITLPRRSKVLSFIFKTTGTFKSWIPNLLKIIMAQVTSCRSVCS